MPLIGSIVLDDVREPYDLATALRLLLQDHFDRDEFWIENPDSPFTRDGATNYRFYGDESSFVLGFDTGRDALRVDVRRAEDDEPAESDDDQIELDPGDQDQDQAERNDLTGQTGDESRLIAAYRALKIPLGVALRRLEDESGEEPAEPTVKAGCCEGGQCRFGWRRLFGVSRSSPSPTTRTPDQIELSPASDVAGPAALPEIQDPVLARLIDAFHLAEDESDRTQGEASAAEDRYQDAGRMLAEHFAAAHAERDPDGSLIGYREFVYQGRSYRLEEPTPDAAHKPGSRRPYVVYRHPDILTV